MQGLTHRRTFWIASALLAAVAVLIAWRLFPLAVPIVHLDITFSRQQALAAALERARTLDLAPASPRTAIRFNHDGGLQNYVELEGGGKSVFAELVASEVYAPYRWDVRLFAP